MSLIIPLRELRPWALKTSKDSEQASDLLHAYLRTAQTLQPSSSSLFTTKSAKRLSSFVHSVTEVKAFPSAALSHSAHLTMQLFEY